jgi:hypothetical protein
MFTSREQPEMKTDAQGYEPADAESGRISGGATEFSVQGAAAEYPRAAQNILQWTSYLPPDCIKSMIAMGWDRTT